MDRCLYMEFVADCIVELISKSYNMHQHEHGPQCRHGHAHGSQHQAHGMGPSTQLLQMSPEDYFKSLRQKYTESKQFFWQQVLTGLSLDKFQQKFGLEFLRSINCQMPMMMLMSLEMSVNCQWMPYRLKHVTAGLFFPLLFLLFFNFNVAVGVAHQNAVLNAMITITLGIYLLVGFRGSGYLKTEQMQRRSKEVYSVRPYLQNPQMSCNNCSVIRLYRSAHCPVCKTCVAKHSRHSVVFGVCVGAPNELLALLFFLSLFATQCYVLYLFFVANSYGLITKLMFYMLNVSVCWMSFVETATLLILNIWYGVTEQQMKMWPMQQYLLKVPARQFVNNVNQGPLLNLIGSVYALLGISGYESENNAMANPLAFAPIDPSRSYRINWAKAMFYLIPQLPMHKNREHIQQLLQREEPRMIEMYKLQNKFKEEAIAEGAAQNLNEMQIQQRTAMKMQAHMMKNMPQMMQPPSPEQQRMIQLQMLAHMQKEFSSEPDLAVRVQELQKELEEGSLTPIETNMRMRQLQQELMGRRMGKVMKEHGQLQNRQQDPNHSGKSPQKSKQSEQEDEPMKIADQDL